MQLFLHAICKQRSHALLPTSMPTKMPYMYSYCCYRRKKMSTAQENAALDKTETKTPEKSSNSIVRISFLFQILACVALLCTKQTSLKSVQDPGHALYSVHCLRRLFSNLRNGSNLFPQLAQVFSYFVVIIA
jgi:hypothetical protein